MRVTILRGLPGSGKTSYFTRSVSDAYGYYSADDFFLKNGLYQFDPKLLPEAHNDCYRRFASALMSRVGHDVHLVVDNTNIAAWEVSSYYRLAEAFGAEVKVVTVWCDPETAFKRGTHGVPFSTVLTMYHRLLKEELPPWWKHEVVS